MASKFSLMTVIRPLLAYTPLERGLKDEFICQHPTLRPTSYSQEKAEGRRQRADRRNKTQTSYLSHQPSRVPVHLQSVAALANQLLRSVTSIGANNAEACNAISKADFKSKSYIALKEARESLYWIDLLHRNGYLDDKQYTSIYTDCEELVKILVARCKKLDAEMGGKEK